MVETIKSNLLKLKEKTIRDSVHGDITFDPKFISIIDTPEFQRLRRIRQLSTAYLIFPTAEHTRFTHSIGTYHVMKLLINHFSNIFEEINLPLDVRSINLALAVALLHDIGHGPFSHAFEDALPTDRYKKKHEQWTIEIVTSMDSNVNKVLIENFDESFPEEVAELIRKEKGVKKNGLKEGTVVGLDLFFVLSSLISSQLDADRMDYLLRDAFFTGVTYGGFDIKRLIKALTITVSKDKPYVCVHEKYLSTLEEYLLARYQMHDSVYFHPFKIMVEKIVKKILQRAFELYNENEMKEEEIPGAILSVFKGEEITVTQYTSLDDSAMIAVFANWKNHVDKILSTLCAAFLDRNKYRELHLLNNSRQDINHFEKDLIIILKKYGFKGEDLDSEYFWIADKPDKPNNVVYKNKENNIWILRNDGTLSDLMDVSLIINEDLKQQKNVAYINVDILSLNITEAVGDIEDLIDMYNNRTHVEIEKKYFVNNEGIFAKIVEVLSAWDTYEISETVSRKEQVDTYYDTDDKILLNSNRTLRVREKDGDSTLTIKVPTKKSSEESASSNNDDQNVRFEYEAKLSSTNLDDSADYIRKYITEFRTLDFEHQLHKKLIIVNQRKKLTIRKANIVFEMVFDSVKYTNGVTGKTNQEYQVEIELKSDFLHRVNLKHLTDYIEKNVAGLTPTTISKYIRGCTLTE